MLQNTRGPKKVEGGRPAMTTGTSGSKRDSDFHDKMSSNDDDQIQTYVCYDCCRYTNQTPEEREMYDPLCKRCYEAESDSESENECESECECEDYDEDEDFTCSECGEVCEDITVTAEGTRLCDECL